MTIIILLFDPQASTIDSFSQFPKNNEANARDFPEDL